jgi:thiol-disulfide isomerase/thioredoxin
MKSRGISYPGGQFMRRFFSIAAILFFCAAGARAAIQVGDRPTLQFTTVDGQPLTLGQYSGKMVILYFWASWCGPAMQEAPHLVTLEKQYQSQGLQFIGVSLDRSVADAQSAAKDAGFDWPQGCDCQGWNSSLVRFWRVNSIPRAYLISPDGEILWIGLPSQIDQPLADAFKAHPPAKPSADDLDRANWNLDKAEAAADSDPRGAIAALAMVPVPAMQDDKIAGRVLALEDQLLPAVQKDLATAANVTDRNQYLDVAVELRNIRTAYAGTSIAATADAKLQADDSDAVWHEAVVGSARRIDAARYLSDAQRLAAEKQDYAAYLLFKRIATFLPNTPSAEPARQALAIYNRDPNFAQRARDFSAAPKAKPMLQAGESAQVAGNIPLAIVKFRGVVELFPSTSFAATAQAALDEINKSNPPNPATAPAVAGN